MIEHATFHRINDKTLHIVIYTLMNILCQGKIVIISLIPQIELFSFQELLRVLFIRIEDMPLLANTMSRIMRMFIKPALIFHEQVLLWM